jgi:CBS domain-containing protein
MKALDTIIAKDVMTSPVVCVGVNDGLSDVEQCLIDAHVTGLPAVEEGRLVGIITRSDYVRLPILLKAYDEYVSNRRHENGMQQQDRAEFHEFRSRLGTLTVHDVMTSKVVTCTEDTPISDIASKMLNHHVHRVVVVDQDRPIGIVGSLDLVKLLEH